MKKALSLCLIALFLLCPCISCGQQAEQTTTKKILPPSAPVAGIRTTQEGGGISQTLTVTEELQTAILSALEGAVWEDCTVTCAFDFRFTAGDCTLQYASFCGTFRDDTNQRSCRLSTEARAKVNAALSVPEQGSDNIEPMADLSILQLILADIHPGAPGPSTSQTTLSQSHVAYELKELLATATKTGETVPEIAAEAGSMDNLIALSRDAYEKGEEMPLPFGTRWLWIGEKQYRISPDLSRVCLINRTLGEGEVIAVTPELKEKLSACIRQPVVNAYTGACVDGKFTLEHTEKTVTPVHLHLISLEQIDLQNGTYVNRLTLQVFSSVEQEVSIHLQAMASADVEWGQDSAKVTVPAGTAQTVVLEFSAGKSSGNYASYYFDLSAAKNSYHINVKVQNPAPIE